MIHELAVHAATAAGCEWWDGFCVLGKVGEQAVEKVQSAGLAAVAGDFFNGWAQLEMWFLASWLALPLLVDITNPTGTAKWLQDSLGQLTFFLAVLGALVAAGYTFVMLGPDRIQKLGIRLGVLLLISTAGGLMIAALDGLVRTVSLWLLQQAGVTAVSGLATATAQAMSPATMLIIGFLATLAVLIQWGIMIVRSALVPILVGVWPLTAAAATLGGQAGEQAFQKVTAWLLAFVIYPLPAGVVYAAAFRMKSGADGIGGIMYGCVLEVLAIFLMPAIMRIIAPQTQALGNAWGGNTALKMAAQAVETAATVGAMVLTAGFAGAAGGKAFAATQPSGASTPTTTNGPTPDPGSGSPSESSGGGSTGDGGGGSSPVSADESAPSAATSPPPAGDGAESTAGNGAGATAEPGSSGSGPEGSGAPADGTPQATVPDTASPGTSPATAQPGQEAAASERAARRRYAALQAGQAAAQAGSRAVRDGIDDVDEMIGGKL